MSNNNRKSVGFINIKYISKIADKQDKANYKCGYRQYTIDGLVMDGKDNNSGSNNAIRL